MSYRETQRVDTMLARISLYLKDECKFMKMCNTDKCNLTPLYNCNERTAKATGKRTGDISNAIARVRARQKRQQIMILNEHLKDQDCVVIEDERQINFVEVKRKRTAKGGAKTDSKLYKARIPKKGKTIKKRIQEDSNIIIDNNKTENLKINIEYLSSPTDISGSNISNSSMVNIDKVMDNNQREFPSMSTELVANRIPPSTKQYSAQTCKEQLDPPILRQTLQFENEVEENSDRADIGTITDINQKIGFPSTFIEQEYVMQLVHPNQRCTIQFEDENSENDSQVNSDTETYIIKEEEFEDEQEFEAVSYEEQDCQKLEHKIDVSDTSSSEQFIYFSENLPSSSKSDNNLYKIIENENVEFVCIKNEVHSNSSDED
ncbi:uncharacterized protein LOC123876388 [Maniola jurtina]|uniref:uncharacterized protein LOC123876388 n=1 Tax=Maniola jurtina TaxID=191418 RepID=UPI001E685FCA|nr:uncharacterized protein LOC123876388 [Maniola jurtina]